MQLPKKKILVVDDDPVICKVLKERLSSNGFQVIEAGDASTGVALAKQEHPDLILLDVMMPNRDGIQTFATLRQESTTKETPIIFLTALSDGLDPLTSSNPRRGYWMFGKPYRPEELLKAIQQAVRQPWEEGAVRL